MVPSCKASLKSHKAFWGYKKYRKQTKGHQKTITTWIASNWRRALWKERLFIRVKMLH